MNFDTLVRMQRELGFDDSAGVRGKLTKAGNGVERIINENMTWLADGDARKLKTALLTMRFYETEYRLTQFEYDRQLFERAYKNFVSIFDNVDGTPEMKGALEQQVKDYADTFKAWIAKPMTAPADARADRDRQQAYSAQRRPDHRAGARHRRRRPRRALAVSQRHTRIGIIAVGAAMVLLGLGFSWLIGRSITRPLHGLAAVMQRLATGDTSARIPATHARDEIGEMARSVIVFRDTMIEREALAQQQAETGEQRERRSVTIATTIGQFKHTVENALGKLRAASMKLEMSSSDLNKSADTVSAEAETATARVSAASENVSAAAGLGRGTGGLDRRESQPVCEIDRGRAPRRVGSAAHGRHDGANSAARRPASARSSGSSRRSPARPICSRSMPRSRPRAPARPARASPSSLPRSNRSPARPRGRPRRSPTRSAPSSRPPPTRRRRSSR